MFMQMYWTSIHLITLILFACIEKFKKIGFKYLIYENKTL